MSRDWVVPTALAVAAVVHLLPLPGLLGAAQLQSLYGLATIDATTLILLRHRALMFAQFAAMLLLAIRVPALRTTAIALVLISDIAFLWLALVDHVPEALMRVVIADAVAIAALLLAAARPWREPQTMQPSR